MISVKVVLSWTGDDSEVLRFETPGRTQVLGCRGCFFSFFHGRAGVDDNPLSRAAALTLAQKLGARVLG